MGVRVLSRVQVSPEEVKVILQSYKDPQSVLVGGFKVNGVKYLAISTPDMEGNLNMLLGKKVSCSNNGTISTNRNEQGKEGLVVAKTNQALILAHHSEATLTVSCVGVVEDLAAYLKSQGY